MVSMFVVPLPRIRRPGASRVWQGQERQPTRSREGQSAQRPSSVACAAEGGGQVQGAFRSCYSHAGKSRCRSPVAGRDSVALRGQCAGGLASACQKQLAEIRNVKAQYQQVWVDFLKQTLKTLRQQASEFQKKMADLQSQEEQVQEKLKKAKLQLSQLSAGLEAKPEEAAEMAVSEPVRVVADMATVTAF